MNIEFTGKVIFWRGPAPYFFVAVPEGPSRDIKSISNLVTYGWGVIPVRAQIGGTEFETSLFPKDGRYLLPLKVAVRKAENLAEGDEVSVQMEVR
ncbi:MAG: DUF1905 domain-containing protein [Chloroflexi bacterium]|nr:DUF1905 domain-containing protein [Chloroflexota bacterium]